MAGARPDSFKRGGGGFLDGVDSVITDYNISDSFNGEDYKPGKITFVNSGGKTETMDKPHSLNVLLSVRVDGADEDTTTTLKVAGEYDAWEVSDDGYVITPVDEKTGLSANAAFSKFIESLVKAGFPADNFPEDAYDWRAMIGTRIRMVQRKDVERTEKFGQKKSKDGKKAYDRKDLVVDQVYEVPSKSKAGKTSKAGKAAPAEVEFDLRSIAGQALVEMLTKAGGTIEKKQTAVKCLTVAVLKKAPNTAHMQEVREYLLTDAGLAELVEDGLIAYSKKTGTISLAEAEEDEDAA